MSRQRIIEAASALFAKSGIKRLTMDDLAKHIGISKRTIYEYFKNKEELLVACINDYTFGSGDFTQKVLLGADNMVEAMLLMIQMDAKQASHQQVSLIEDVRKYYPLVYKEHLLRLNADRSIYFEQIIHLGMKEGVFRKNQKLEMIVHFFNSRAVDISYDNRFTGKLSHHEIFENIAVTFLRGICTAKGLEILDKNKYN